MFYHPEFGLARFMPSKPYLRAGSHNFDLLGAGQAKVAEAAWVMRLPSSQSRQCSYYSRESLRVSPTLTTFLSVGTPGEAGFDAKMRPARGGDDRG
jgi:hypothetical protein